MGMGMGQKSAFKPPRCFNTQNGSKLIEMADPITWAIYITFDWSTSESPPPTGEPVTGTSEPPTLQSVGRFV
jgi:hypothetical protein